MVLSASLVGSLLLTSCSAMMKVFAVIIVGAFIAQVPKESPYLPKEALKYVSRLSNSVFLPNLIVTALGSSLTPQSLSMMSVLILFAMTNMITSYLLAITLGNYLNKDDPATFQSLVVAIASPNAISLPIMVMATLCEQPIVAKDFDNDPGACQVEATAMLFVYSVGWHFVYWSFGFPELQRVKKVYIDKIVVKKAADWKQAVAEFIQDWVCRVALSGVMIAIVVGIVVGSWPALKDSLFFDSRAFLRPIGSAMTTLGQPVVCLNSVIMAASLAMVPKEELIEQLHRVLGPCSGVLSYFGITNTSTKNKVIDPSKLAPRIGSREARKTSNSNDVSSSSNDVSSNSNDVSSSSNDKNSSSNDTNSSSIDTNSSRSSSNDKNSSSIIASGDNKYTKLKSGIELDGRADVIGCAAAVGVTVEDSFSSVSPVSNPIRGDVNDEEEELDSSASASASSLKLTTRHRAHSEDCNYDVKVAENSTSQLALEAGNAKNLPKTPADIPTKLMAIEFADINRAVPVAKPTNSSQETPATPVQYRYHSDRLILIHSVCRLIIPPIIMISLVYVIYGVDNPAYDSGFYRLLRLVIVVESGQPSAQVIMVCMQQLDVPYIATRLSYLYIYQYLFAIVTITISTSIIMSMLYF